MNANVEKLGSCCELPSDGCLPAYKRTGVTDALHEAFGFRTDSRIVSKAAMKKVLAETKKAGILHIRKN